MYVETGQVELAISDQSGTRRICGLLEAGAFVGEESLGGHAIWRHTVTAMRLTEVLVIAKAEMVRLLRNQDALRDHFISYMLARERRLETDLLDQLFHSAEQRVARALLLLAGCGTRSARRCVLPPISQQDIADMVGTTRARVNAMMGKFKRRGFIDKRGSVIQVSPSLVQVMENEGSAVFEHRA
jgi:CRP-like cAMP-binding protein